MYCYHVVANALQRASEGYLTPTVRMQQIVEVV